MCPECETVYKNWAFLKGHLRGIHKVGDPDALTKESLEQYAITAEEALGRKERRKVLTAGKTLKEVPVEPVEGLEAIPSLNRIDEVTTARAVNVFRVNPQCWGDPYWVERLLTSPVSKRRDLIASLLEQDITGLEVPKELGGAYPMSPGPQRRSLYYGTPTGGEGGRGNTPAIPSPTPASNLC